MNVSGSKFLGGNLQQWQSPSDPWITYVGSYFTGGHPVTVVKARKALAELRGLHRRRKAMRLSATDVQHLDNLIQAMVVRIRRAKVAKVANPSKRKSARKAPKRRAKRTAAQRSASARKGAATRKRNARKSRR